MRRRVRVLGYLFYCDGWGTDRDHTKILIVAHVSVLPSPDDHPCEVATKATKDLSEAKIQENNDEKYGRDILTLLGAFVLWSQSALVLTVRW